MEYAYGVYADLYCEVNNFGEWLGTPRDERRKVGAVRGGRHFEHMIMTAKGVLNGIWQFCRYLFWPQWGSKRRRAQEEYERMLEEGKVK